MIYVIPIFRHALDNHSTHKLHQPLLLILLPLLLGLMFIRRPVLPRSIPLVYNGHGFRSGIVHSSSSDHSGDQGGRFLLLLQDCLLVLQDLLHWIQGVIYLRFVVGRWGKSLAVAARPFGLVGPGLDPDLEL